MTAVLPRRAVDTPTGMPGWTIVANLTPPELIDSRELGRLRLRIAVVLALVAVLCGAGYAYEVQQHGAASDAAAAESAHTGDLRIAASKYAGITRIEDTVAAVRAQVNTVMHDDVDVAKVLASIRSALPGSMTIGNLSLTITPASAQSTTSLDASGHAAIGSVTITGSGRSLDDLPAFVDRLSAVTGLANVLPTSNLVNSGTAQFSVTCTLTDALYSHRYDVKTTGGK